MVVRSKVSRAVALAAWLLGASGDEQPRTWQELHEVFIPATKIMIGALETTQTSGFGGLFPRYGFGQNWLRLEGLDDPSLLSSANFAYRPLEHERGTEWAATLSGDHRVVLKAGAECRCNMTGLAVYHRSQDFWMRLHFEGCQGCESGAGRAGVLIPLQRHAGAGGDESNLVDWMCTVNPHGACGPEPAATTPATAAPTTAPATTTTTEAPTTTSTVAPTTHRQNVRACSVTKVTLSASSPVSGLGCGAGLHWSKAHAAHVSEGHCRSQCQTTYIQTASKFFPDFAGHLDDVNADGFVCRAFAYSSETSECFLFMRETRDDSRKDPDIPPFTGREDAFVCFGDVRGTALVDEPDLSDPDCTTTTRSTVTVTKTATTTTRTGTTTTTSRTTTTVTTTKLAPLHLLSAFGGAREEARAYDFPDEVHFPFPQGHREAALLQLQAPCVEAVDYYLLGARLPVGDADGRWAMLLKILSGHAQPPKLTDGAAKCVATGATMEWMPMEVSFGEGPSCTRVLPSALVDALALFVQAAVAVGPLFYVLASSASVGPGGTQERGLVASLLAPPLRAAGGLLAFLAAGGAALLAALAVGAAAHGRPAGQTCGGLLTLVPTLHRAALPVAGAAWGAALAWLLMEHEPPRARQQRWLSPRGHRPPASGYSDVASSAPPGAGATRAPNPFETVRNFLTG